MTAIVATDAWVLHENEAKPMKKTLLPICLLLFAIEAPAAGRPRDCDELSREIAAKIESNGVKHYTLVTLEAGTATTARIVGSCAGGTRRIAYTRIDAPAGSDVRVTAAR